MAAIPQLGSALLNPRPTQAVGNQTTSCCNGCCSQFSYRFSSSSVDVVFFHVSKNFGTCFAVCSFKSSAFRFRKESPKLADFCKFIKSLKFPVCGMS